MLFTLRICAILPVAFLDGYNPMHGCPSRMHKTVAKEVLGYEHGVKGARGDHSGVQISPSTFMPRAVRL